MADLSKQTTASSTVDTSLKRSNRNRAWKRFFANRIAVVGAITVILLILMAVFADFIAPHHPIDDVFRGKRGAPPTLEGSHFLGYDHIGRDLLSRVIPGSRIALLVGLLSTLIAVLIGVAIGAVSGYFGGWVDEVLSLITDMLMAFPLIALLIVLAAVVSQRIQAVMRDTDPNILEAIIQQIPNPSVLVTILVIGATAWSRYARVVRAEVMSVRQREYVTAAQALGARDGGVIWRHIIPNILSSVIVLASLQIGSIIILESALSFLGLGVRPPTPSWGGILADGRQLLLRAPHISTFPGIMIVITVLAFNFLGDGLRDALDPHEKDY